MYPKKDDTNEKHLVGCSFIGFLLAQVIYVVRGDSSISHMSLRTPELTRYLTFVTLF
jgi:hypothetical protein